MRAAPPEGRLWGLDFRIFTFSFFHILIFETFINITETTYRGLQNKRNLVSLDKTTAVTAPIWRYAYTGGFAYFSTPVNVGHMGFMIFFEKCSRFCAKNDT